METALIMSDIYSSGSEPVTPALEDINTRLEYDIAPESKEPARGLRTVDSLQAEHSTTDCRKTPILSSPVSSVIKPLKGNFKLLQFWEGIVLEINDESQEFTAKISDKTEPSYADEQLTLSNEEIDPNDLPLFVPGAVFYWSIGYADYPGRPRIRESRIRFRRLRQWTQSELNIAEERGKQLADFFASY